MGGSAAECVGAARVLADGSLSSGQIKGRPAPCFREKIAEAYEDCLFLFGGVFDLGAQDADLSAGASLDLA